MHKKRGQSFYAEVIDPSVKKFLHQCNLCGKVGIKPSIDEDDYNEKKDLKTVKWDKKMAMVTRMVALRHLRRVYEPLPLNAFGRCEICARLAEKDVRANKK